MEPNSFFKLAFASACSLALAGPVQGSVPDLGLTDFFSAGWDQAWLSRPDRFTPDMALFRVTTNFLERELRIDTSRSDLRGTPAPGSQDLVSALVAYGLNRRLMLEVLNSYQWNQDPRGGPGANAVIFGEDLPIGGRGPSNRTVRLTYVLNF